MWHANMKRLKLQGKMILWYAFTSCSLSLIHRQGVQFKLYVANDTSLLIRKVLPIIHGHKGILSKQDFDHVYTTTRSVGCPSNLVTQTVFPTWKFKTEVNAYI